MVLFHIFPSTFSERVTNILMGSSTEFLFFWYPRDQAVVDKGFETEDILNFHQWILSIPPSSHTNLQMTKDVAKA